MDRMPILKIGETLILSIQPDLHDRAALRLQEDILEKISETRVRGLVIDVTAMGLVDSFMGRLLSDSAAMAKNMGVDTVLVGVQPEIAITLQELGLGLKGIHIALNLEKGLALLQKIRKTGHGED